MTENRLLGQVIVATNKLRGGQRDDFGVQTPVLVQELQPLKPPAISQYRYQNIFCHEYTKNSYIFLVSQCKTLVGEASLTIIYLKRPLDEILDPHLKLE